jgi:hypothetical protein
VAPGGGGPRRGAVVVAMLCSRGRSVRGRAIMCGGVGPGRRRTPGEVS